MLSLLSPGDLEQTSVEKKERSWMLRPATIVVHLHDTIETQGLAEEEIEALPDRIYQIVSGPVHAALRDAGSRNAIG